MMQGSANFQLKYAAANANSAYGGSSNQGMQTQHNNYMMMMGSAGQGSSSQQHPALNSRMMGIGIKGTGGNPGAAGGSFMTSEEGESQTSSI
jgi:hypothetical protein